MAMQELTLRFKRNTPIPATLPARPRLTSGGHRYTVTLLVLQVLFNAAALNAAPSKDVYGNTEKTEAPPPPPPAPPASPSTERLPLIEVSVDALEISESNSDILGFLWGQVGQVQNGVTLLD